MVDVLIQLTKRADGTSVLRCTRADGSATWQRRETPHARFFALHDLAHYAVEIELRVSRGFYGLIAEGWEIADTTGKGARGSLPPEALVVEHIVGSLDVERAGGEEWSAADFNAQAATFFAANGVASPKPLSEDQLSRIRARIAELHARWFLLPAGQTLELAFDLR